MPRSLPVSRTWRFDDREWRTTSMAGSGRKRTVHFRVGQPGKSTSVSCYQLVAYDADLKEVVRSFVIFWTAYPHREHGGARRICAPPPASEVHHVGQRGTTKLQDLRA
jgi:hypothetical protein